jgi:hypothetical protein
MKILRVTVESVDVPDDHPLLLDDGVVDSNTIRFETAGNLYASYELPGKQFGFTSVTPKLEPISVYTRLLYWLTVSILDIWFDDTLQSNYKNWVSKFVVDSRPFAFVLAKLIRNRKDREQEILTGQINFKDWDSKLFDPSKKYYYRSLN